jgi:hypothetical protein
VPPLSPRNASRSDAGAESSSSRNCFKPRDHRQRHDEPRGKDLRQERLVRLGVAKVGGRDAPFNATLGC